MGVFLWKNLVLEIPKKETIKTFDGLKHNFIKTHFGITRTLLFICTPVHLLYIILQKIGFEIILHCDLLEIKHTVYFYSVCSTL